MEKTIEKIDIRSLDYKELQEVCDPQGGYAGASDIEEGSYGKIPL